MRDVLFWKALLNIEEYRDEYGFVVYGMTDELFVEECEFYEELLLADNLMDIISHIGIILNMFRLLLE